MIEKEADSPDPEMASQTGELSRRGEQLIYTIAILFGFAFIALVSSGLFMLLCKLIAACAALIKQPDAYQLKVIDMMNFHFKGFWAVVWRYFLMSCPFALLTGPLIYRRTWELKTLGIKVPRGGLICPAIAADMLVLTICTILVIQFCPQWIVWLAPIENMRLAPLFPMFFLVSALWVLFLTLGSCLGLRGMDRMAGFWTQTWILLPFLSSMLLPVGELIARTDITFAGFVVIAIVLTLLVVILKIPGWGYRQKELNKVREILRAGGSLVVFTGPILSKRNLTNEYTGYLGSIADGLQGSYILHGRNLVVSGWGHYLKYLRKTPAMRKTLIILWDELDTYCLSELRREVERLSGEGWTVLAVDKGESILQPNAWAVFDGLPVTVGVGLKNKDGVASWIQQRFRDEDGTSHQDMLMLINTLVQELPEDNIWLRYIRQTLAEMTRKFDEIESFYQLLKIAEYILHCRALLSCREGNNKKFPRSPALGSLEERQRSWPCESDWGTKRIQQAVSLLQAACEKDVDDENKMASNQKSGQNAGGRAKDARRAGYSGAMSVLAQIYNCYVGHGTMAYRVMPEVVEALLAIVEPMIRDFQKQGEFPSPADQVAVEACAEPIHACMIEFELLTEHIYLLSFVFRPSGESKAVWCEYLDYETGNFLYQGDREQTFHLGLLTREANT